MPQNGTNGAKDKFVLHPLKKHGKRRGQRLIGLAAGETDYTIQDLLAFLRSKGIDPSKVFLPNGFITHMIAR